MSLETVELSGPLTSGINAPASRGRPLVVAIALHPLMILGLITILGGIIRFAYLDRPQAWIDESMTYYRVCGSFDQMLDTLENQGFPPLHYEIEWLIKHKIPLSLKMLRLFPALCGTLMIPAMYFLARQLFSRRLALTTALFTACSAWLIHYSRDAKMYAPLWLFVALNAACLMWWMRTGLITAWLAWTATGCMMVGLQALGFVVLIVQPLWMLTARRCHWVRGIMFVIGLAIISAGPIGYYSTNNRWEGRGIDWVERRNRGIPAMELAGDTSSAFLFCYAWIQENKSAEIPPIINKASTAALAAVLVLLAIGAFPWRIKNRPGLLEATEPWWREVMWIAMWILLPAYGFYLASDPGAEGPLSWWATATATLEKRWWIFAIVSAACAAAWFYSGFTLRERCLKLGQFALISGVILGLICGLHAIASRIKNPLNESVWMPRYLGVLWPAVAMVVATLLLRLPTRPLRWLAISTFIGLNLAQAAAGIFASNEPPIDRVAREVIESHQSASHLLTYTPPTHHQRSGPGGGQISDTVGKVYLVQFSGTQMSPKALIRLDPWSDFSLRWSADSRRVLADLQSRPDVDRIIVWQRTEQTEPKTDPLLAALGSSWVLKSETVYPIRVNWSWGWLYDYRRREYVKKNAAAPTFMPH